MQLQSTAHTLLVTQAIQFCIIHQSWLIGCKAFLLPVNDE